MAQTVVKLSALTVTVVLARYLGEDDFGRYTVAVALVSLVAASTDLGAGTYVAREGTRTPPLLAVIVGQVIALRMMLTVIGIGIASCVALILDYDHKTVLTVLFLMIAVGIRGIASAMLAALQALERLGTVAAVQIREAVAGVVSILLAALLGAGVVGVALASGVAATLSPVWAYRRLKRALRTRIRARTAGLRKTMVLLSPFAASVIFTTALTYLDSVMVHAFRGNAETGLYGAAYRLFMAFEVLPAVYFGAALRSATQVAHRDRQALSGLYSASLLHVMVVAVPLVVAGVCLSRPLLVTIYGPTYGDAATTFALLMSSIAFTFPAWMIIMVCYALGKERTWAVIVGLAVVINGIANLVVIPHWGIEGAAAVTLASVAFASIAGGVALAQYDIEADIGRVVYKPLLAGLAMTVLVLLLKDAHLVVPLIVGGVAYIVVLGLLRTFDSSDWHLARSMLAGQRSDSDGAA